MAPGMNIDLKELVAAIRDELEAVDQNRILARKASLFHLTEMQLELNFTVASQKKGKAGFSLQVLSAGAEGSVSSEQVQKVTLKYVVSPDAARGTILGARAHSLSRAQPAADVSPLDDE